ncbi:MinD-like ATPase involved in chromosome partitioning or flagellar assembly [Catenuloplanes nepalensis]|uniref:MinD-like ATPase involved in chromosome partitioning or flagellar assembly n=1 Tax=Catenuloplanes nepalensis TaxID=587533 RepID=A0ABT9ML03_9ACTN|nr:AAA family ATPase [Catenuloplanes nepalensis]MDP9791986.1 MinD-like ATPase involved in chromosome partitioning or flagellar assembly [Catenuloplanes nepalensis]
MNADRAGRGEPGYPANGHNGHPGASGYPEANGYPEGGNRYGAPEGDPRRGYFESTPPGGGPLDAPVPPPDSPLPRRPQRTPASPSYGAAVNGRQQDPVQPPPAQQPPMRPGPDATGTARRQPYPPAGGAYGGPQPVQPPPVTPSGPDEGFESRYAALDPRYSPVQPGRYPSGPPMPPAGAPAPPPVPQAAAPAPPVPQAPPMPPAAAQAPPGGAYGGAPQAYAAPERDYPPQPSRYSILSPPGYVPPPPPPKTEPPAPQAQPAAPARFQEKNVGFLGGAAPEPAARPAMDVETERAISVLKRDLGGPRVMAFANPKGGVHKTTATVLASAAVGSVRGKGVLAWDDNELRGTLGLRAGSARHARTVRHLIAELAQIEITHGAELLDRLDDFLRHASDGSYDVLAGEENPRFAQRLDQHTVRRVLELLRRTHDVICVDTGNNVESVNWQTVLQAADQLVVTTVPREDAAFTADWMLDLLDDVGMGDLVSNAVTLISCPTPGKSPLLDDLEKHFKTRTRAVAIVPYDPALETGASIEYHQLQPETRNAWLRATSMMLEPFAR